MKKTVSFLFVLFFLSVAPLWAEEAIGSVRIVTGPAWIVRDGQPLATAQGMPLFAKDLLRTEKQSSLGIILRDDTILSLGPESELALKDYTFEPKDNRFSMVVRMIKGTFVYLSGVIGTLSPESILLETPDSTIAVRGTKLLIKVNG